MLFFMRLYKFGFLSLFFFMSQYCNAAYTSATYDMDIIWSSASHDPSLYGKVAGFTVGWDNSFLSANTSYSNDSVTYSGSNAKASLLKKNSSGVTLSSTVLKLPLSFLYVEEFLVLNDVYYMQGNSYYDSLQIKLRAFDCTYWGGASCSVTLGFSSTLSGGITNSYDPRAKLFSSWSLSSAIIKIDGDSGYTQLATRQVAAVPVPTAAWLMGSGLIGLAGLARRKKI
jgi:hypothetical protein